MAKTVGSLQNNEAIEIPIRQEYRKDFGDYIYLEVVGSNIYCDNSKLMFAKRLRQETDSVGGINFDAKEEKNPRSYRQKHGNPVWSVSNVKCWLNSTEENWYKALHSYDAEPTKYTVSWVTNKDTYRLYPGFLRILDERVLEYIGESKYKAAYDNSNGGYGVSMMTTKVFLPSLREVGVSSSNLLDGETIPALITAMKNETEENQSVIRYMSRTPFDIDGSIRTINFSYGSIGDGNTIASNIIGCYPLMSILNTLHISDSKNERGNYTISFNAAPSAPTGIVAPETCYSGRPLEISWGAATDPEGDSITYYLERSVNSASYTQVTSTAGLTYTESNVSKEWNTLQYRVRAYDGTDYSSYITSGTIAVVHNRPPVLTGEDSDLGEKSINVSYRYTVTDPDGDSVSITEMVDSKTLRTYTARLGEENELDISGDNFTALSIGAHTITITARDAAGNTAKRTLTFTKTITGFSITLREPLPADAMPTRCFVNVSREIPFGSLFRVEACNNPNDTSPVWEDITAAVLASHVHVFANDTDHGLQHGFNIRVTVERKNDLGECWIGGIGGNFE